MQITTFWRRVMVIAALAAGSLTITGGTADQAIEPGTREPAMQGRGGQPAQPQPVPPLRFRFMGPAPSGRIASVAGIPGDKTTYYAGAASGGVWKTTDGGQTFAPVFDDQPVQAIGALAVAPSDPKTVWAGTGEAWVIRPTDVTGDGIYKSADAGATWTHMGLRETGRIGRIVVHPSNPQIVFACALGRATGPQQERGVYRTTNGGTTWERVLFVDPDTGCSGIAMDAVDPNVLLAGTWQVVMHTHGMFSGGPGSAVYLSRDGGSTWTKLTSGLPKPAVGKIDVAIAPSDSRRMYALIQTANQGSLWRSDDAGANWRVVSRDRRLIGRAGYYIRVTVNPANADEVLVANSSFHRSTDGGLTFPITGGGCGDCHDIWMDPEDPGHWVATGDGGMGITTNHGESFTSIVLPIGQMYHVAVDNRVPYWIYSNRQDDGTMRGPADSPVPVSNVPSYAPPAPAGPGRGGRGRGGGFGRGATTPWDTSIGGCESGFTIPNPRNPDVIWASCYGNEVTRYDHRTRRARSVSPWKHTLDHEPTKLKYRCHWTPPLAMDPFEDDTVYYGCQVIFRTANGGQSWDVISPDLSTGDPSRIVFSGGIIGDNLGQFYGAVVYAIAPSPIQKGLIWAGTNDGKVWYTRDGGKKWVDVTKNVTGMAPWGTIAKIEPSSFDPATAYMVVDYHIMDGRDPFIYKTADFGRTWTRISDGLPHGHPLAYVLSLAENPNRRGMLFAGTGNGFYHSMDDGKTWTQLGDGLPAAPVTWIVVQKDHHDVVVSTYGRGLYILGDITRLEQADRVTMTSGAFLYAPRPGFRQARSGSAEFLYTLQRAPSGPVQIEILDAAGTVVRSMSSPGGEGLNRAAWDLRHDGPRQVELRTIPPDNPAIWEEPRFRGQQTRPIIHWGIQQPQRLGPIAAPGKYSVRLRADGATLSQPFEVLKDPAIASPVEDIAVSTKMQVRIRDDMNAAVDMINGIEIVRKQIEDHLKAHAARPDVVKALRDLDARIMNAELQLLSRTELHSDDKWYVEAYRVYMNLVWLSGVVGTGAGDVAGGADYRPTDASVEVLAEIEKDLAAAKAAFDVLMQQEVPAYNRSAAGKVAAIAVTSGS
jgi:photosystem II stability/assembly factor-like uncharacterized protein